MLSSQHRKRMKYAGFQASAQLRILVQQCQVSYSAVLKVQTGSSIRLTKYQNTKEQAIVKMRGKINRPKCVVFFRYHTYRAGESVSEPPSPSRAKFPTRPQQWLCNDVSLQGIFEVLRGAVCPKFGL